MKLKYIITVCLLCFCTLSTSLLAIVKYDEGRIQVGGIQFLQDSEDENAYYYLTRFVKLSTKEDGSFEFLCIKYVGEGEQASGGIFHALVEFAIPQDMLDSLETELKRATNENARIAGPVPMKQFNEKGEGGIGKFDVVSSILTDTDGEDAFTSNVLTSGFSPLLPGSKAAIAAKLNPAGATLLWESLSGPTSDVSVSIHGYYEAVVKGYNAIISAEANTIYEHYSRIRSFQQGFTKDQLRKISDEMIQDQVLEIEVFDRAAGLGIKTSDMQGIVDIVTNKLIELMFDAKTGWSSKPAQESGVEPGQLKGRQERGWFSSVFGGKDDTEYYSDNQYVIKKRSDIRTNKFYLNLSKKTTIKVPIHTSGNIGGIYDTMKEDKRYFRVVNLIDTDFEKRNVHFQVDGGFTDAFNNILNSVSISFRKVYDKDSSAATKNLLFTHSDLEAGKDFKDVEYPRLGIKGSEWLDYEYKVSWNLKGEPKPIIIPKTLHQWQKASAPLIALVPPFKKKIIEIDADRPSFIENEIYTATVRFFVVINGKATAQRTVILRAGDAESTSKTTLYHDEGEPLAYQISWYGKNGKYAEKIKALEEDYMFLMTPSPENFKNQ